MQHRRVLWRLLAMFLVAALVPLAALAVISLGQLTTMLMLQSDQRLAANAKAYGMAVFERIQAAQYLVAANPMPDRVFRGSWSIDPEGRAMQIWGAADVRAAPPALVARAREGKPTLWLGPSPGTAITLLVREAEGSAVIAADLTTEYVWGPRDERPAATDFCVYEEGTRLALHCDAVAAVPLSAIASQVQPSGATFEWLRDGDPQRARAWAQFMGAAFGTRDWVVVASQPGSSALAPLASYKRNYLLSVLLAIVLVAWFTARQSSSVTRPLERLAQRAREVAGGRFAAEPVVNSDDEFGEVATAFNVMAERLGRQFAFLTALSEIDGLILSDSEQPAIIRTILLRLRQTTSAAIVTITLFDSREKSEMRTYRLSEEGTLLAERQVHDAPRAVTGEEGTWITLPADTLDSSLGHHAFHRMGGILVQPSEWRGAQCGLIALGYLPGNEPGHEDRRRARDIADRMAVSVSAVWRDRQLYYQAHFDALTSLPNRLLFADRLEVEAGRSRREGHRFGLLVVDLDHFKNINESFGHSVGDAVLREAARRIGACVRSSDTVARLGGDEFAVLSPDLLHVQELWLIAETIVGEMSREFVTGDRSAHLSASVGIATFPEDGESGEELLKKADIAADRAKAEGRSQALFFEERMNTEVGERLILGRDLRLAMARGELRVHYQPQMNLLTSRIDAAEALLRWTHPVKGAIPPGRFISIAEESGLIEVLGQWVFEQVCRQMAEWRAEGIDVHHVAVNVSPRQFRRRGFVAEIVQALTAHELPRGSIELEITEGLLIDRVASAEETLKELASAGFLVALDDFGTGFSSLSYLERLPVNTIKIDRSFVKHLGEGRSSEAIAAAIVAMSHALGKMVVAEGVETSAQAEALRGMGCQRIQGWLIAPALDAAAFAEMCSRQVATVNHAGQA